MKRFVIVGAFAVAGFVLPGSVLAQQNTPPGGQSPTMGTGQTGTSGQTESAPKGKTAKRAKAAESRSDETFVKQAAEGGLAEVELGKLAAEKAASDDVKKFGQRMVDDHGKANDQLKDVASKKNITLPTDLNAKDKATKARLDKLSGAAFDRAYMADMVRDHTKDVAEFRREAKSGRDADIKGFAGATLPTLESHLKDARSVDATVKGSAKSGASKKDAEKK